jgi:hypothetical protein
MSMGRASACAHALGHAAHVVGWRHVLEQHRELVDADARHGVGAARRVAQARGEGDDEVVARRLAERLVDAAEAVEVDEQQHHVPGLPLGARERVPQAVGEERAVGEVGERVVQRLVREARLEPLLLGDVLHHADEPRPLGQREGGERQAPPARAAVGAQEALLDVHPVALAGAERAHRPARERRVLGRREARRHRPRISSRGGRRARRRRRSPRPRAPPGRAR